MKTQIQIGQKMMTGFFEVGFGLFFWLQPRAATYSVPNQSLEHFSEPSGWSPALARPAEPSTAGREGNASSGQLTVH